VPQMCERFRINVSRLNH